MQKKVSLRKTKFQTSKKRSTVGKKEQRRLIQLVLCLILFLIVFWGKGNLPESMFRYIQVNTDFKEAFSVLGEAISAGEPMGQAFGELMMDVFGAEEETVSSPNTTRAYSAVVQSAISDLERLPERDVLLSRLGITALPDNNENEIVIEDEDITTTEEALILQPQFAEYTGPALPAGASMEYYELGFSELITPVLGEITSAYGYRNHPVDGEYSFHSGVDVAAAIGTPVAAFASGTVDFIGESEAYGLYIQLNHGNDVTTFYCHCSELYAQKGETVDAGQIIASVGETGNTTGPHLHLELKKDGILLNPAYYINVKE